MPVALMELTHEIEPNEQSFGLVSARLIQVLGPAARTLRNGDTRPLSEADREGVAPDSFLDAKGVHRPMDSQLFTIHRCRNDFRHQRDRRADIDSQAYADAERIVAGNDGNRAGDKRGRGEQRPGVQRYRGNHVKLSALVNTL